MNSNLKNIVKGLAMKKKLEWSNTRESKVWNIENDFNNKRTSVDDALRALEGEFSYNLDKYDYKEIRKQLENILKK